MARCLHCGRDSPLIARAVEFCADCIRGSYRRVHQNLDSVHRAVRAQFALPHPPLRDPQGLACRICTNECQIAPGKTGACGLHGNIGGHASGVNARWAKASFYFDPLPTNCVADWVCAASGQGYPEFSYTPHQEYGYYNLAVFYHGCTFNCLFCQNWQNRSLVFDREPLASSDLAAAVNEHTACICFFGGDPTPQLAHSFRTALEARAHRRSRLLRICWETNGSMHPALLQGMAKLALQSGGTIKFDLKAWNNDLHRALCGASNARTLENFRLLARRARERPQPPLLVASTLLVPGYVDETEVEAIARFIAALDPDIPYALLAFHPHFYLSDLPRTSRRHAQSCFEAARNAGLTNVRLANVHLLSEAY
jgi:pyruvate formate lyase activating enzyme